MSNGWITLHRKIMDSSIWSDSQAVHLWIHLLLKVNHAPKEVIKGENVYFIKRGQTLTGRKALSSETGINESKIQRLLKVFVKCKMIEQQTTSVNRLISITNYESYQVGEQQTNNKRTTSEQQTNTNNNDNNKKQLKTMEERKASFHAQVKSDWERLGEKKYMSPVDVTEFYDYWTECGVNDTKMRFEKEKSFGVGRRLGTWKKGIKKPQGSIRP